MAVNNFIDPHMKENIILPFHTGEILESFSFGVMSYVLFITPNKEF